MGLIRSFGLFRVGENKRHCRAESIQLTAYVRGICAETMKRASKTPDADDYVQFYTVNGDRQHPALAVRAASDAPEGPRMLVATPR